LIFTVIHLNANSDRAPELLCGEPSRWTTISAALHRSAGTERLVRIDGKMNRAKYRVILDENLLQSAQDLRLG
jgi:hypothetical protein